MQRVFLLLPLAFLIFLGGCSVGAPVSERSYSEQQEWLEQQFEGVIKSIGVADGWYDILNDVSWNEQRQQVLETAGRLGCIKNNERVASQSALILGHQGLENPVSTVIDVGNYLEEHGWDVRVIADHRELDPPYLSIVADHPDGYGAEVGGAVGFTIGFTAECSKHETMNDFVRFPGPGGIEYDSETSEE